MRRHFWTIVCAVFFISNSAVTDKEAEKEMPNRQERGFKPIPLSPEKSARHTTDRMDSLLSLTKKQYDKLYKLNLKWAREDRENKPEVPPMGGRPEGKPDFGGARHFGQGPRGNRPPEGIDRRPPRDFSPSDDREKMEKQRKKREKKLKKILTDEQYARWVAKQYPIAPEGRGKKGKED